MGKLIAIGNQLLVISNKLVEFVAQATGPSLSFLLNWATGTYKDIDGSYKITDTISGNDLLVNSPVLKSNGVDNYIDTGIIPSQETFFCIKCSFNMNGNVHLMGVLDGSNLNRFYIGINSDRSINAGWGNDFDRYDTYIDDSCLVIILHNNNVFISNTNSNLEISDIELILNSTPDFSLQGTWKNMSDTIYLFARHFNTASSLSESQLYHAVIGNYNGSVISESFRVIPEGAGPKITNLVDNSEININGTLTDIHQVSEYQEPIYMSDHFVFTDDSAPTDSTKNRYVKNIGQGIPTLSGYTYAESITGGELKESGSVVNYPAVTELINADVSEKLFTSGVPKNLTFTQLQAFTDNVFVKNSNGEVLFYDENNSPTGSDLTQTEDYINS